MVVPAWLSIECYDYAGCCDRAIVSSRRTISKFDSIPNGDPVAWSRSATGVDDAAAHNTAKYTHALHMRKVTTVVACSPRDRAKSRSALQHREMKGVIGD